MVFSKYIGEDIAIIASIIAGILTTGAFHEDGFADCCDAFGGGWTKEKILTIMKDSRLGTFGVIGLISILAVKFLLLKEILKFTPDLEAPTVNVFANYGQFLLLLLAAHGTSRLMGVYTIRFYDYVTDIDASKAKPITSKKPSIGLLAVATLFALAPFFITGLSVIGGCYSDGIGSLAEPIHILKMDRWLYRRLPERYSADHRDCILSLCYHHLEILVMSIYLIRHTAPLIEKGTCYGQADIDIKDSFFEEAAIIQTVIPADVRQVWSSPLQRCLEAGRASLSIDRDQPGT